MNKQYLKGNVVHFGTKWFIRIPYGEIMIGTKYKSIVVWFRGKKFRIKKPRIS